MNVNEEKKLQSQIDDKDRVAKEMVVNDDLDDDKLCIQYILQFKSDSKLWGEDHERMARKVSMNEQAS